jgi:hypothetical protein
MSEPLQMQAPANDLKPEPLTVQPLANSAVSEPLESRQQVIRIGPDQVTITADAVVIEAKHETADWEVRTHNAPVIYFQDRKYLLVEKGEARLPYKIRYVLRPWPAGKIPNPKRILTYGADSVAERDSSRRGEGFNEVMWVCLLPLYPFLGLLWSGLQKRFVRFGYVPRTITGLSIFTSFAMMLMQGVFVVVTINASMRLGKMMVGGIFGALSGLDSVPLGPVSIPMFVFDGLLFLACVADVCVRYSHYLREDQWTGGFLEWLAPQPKREAAPGILPQRAQ